MNRLLKKFKNNFKEINEYYNFLVNKTKKYEYVGIINEWVIDNFYLLVEHKNNIKFDIHNVRKNKKSINKMYPILKDIATKYNYNINFKILCEELNNYQKSHEDVYFNYFDLNYVITTMVFVYADKLNSICYQEFNKLIDKENISTVIKNKDADEIQISDFIDSDFTFGNNNYYIFELNNQLRDLGGNCNRLFKDLNELLESKEVSLKEIINDQYQARIENDMIVSNIFNDLKEFFEINSNSLLEKVSFEEKLFLKDDIYPLCTDETKALYRRRLLKLSKKHRKDELQYLNELIEKASAEEVDLSFLLLENNKKNGRFIIYFLSLIIFTVLITFFISKYFIGIRVLGFIILFIPVSQFVLKIINQFLVSNVTPSVLPKLDYSKGIPEESATMVVIPTIVGDRKKIKSMFDTLETFYLINKSKNLYFTLLGDCKASDKEICDFDEDLSEYGVEYAEKLNKKYGKKIFYFMYRKRLWNAKENQYLGYERKRGALIQFNKVLLGKFFDNDKYFHVNMLYGNELNIKYVITLDTDTRLVLNSALNLVGCMAHPFNRPVIDKKTNKVISGYGIMQPRVSVDIESTNKSVYSRIFAGVGGFDTYTAVVPNVYQDNFGEGSFVGKGIYDLETFDTVLSDRFPDNLILSHDLLEGNYLRCGYVSDIEMVDDFPSKFLIDTTRHHRWARGDVQIISWLGNKVKNKRLKTVKNPISLLGKYKILDNIVRMFLQPLLLIILLCSMVFDKVHPAWWVGFVVVVIAFQILFFLYSNRKRSRKGTKFVYYKNLNSDGMSLVTRCYLSFACLPFYSKLYMDAFFRTMYRLLYSHKNLLNWITAEEVEKTVNGNLTNYIRNFIINFIFAIIFVILGVFTGYLITGCLIAFTFVSAPFILYSVSRDITRKVPELKDKKMNDIKELAERTWNYFKDNLKEKYNYLIPDNYQENRENKLDMRTSPTAIGYSLTAVVSAFELDFIDADDAIHYLDKILNSLDKLEKWNGHLYNWYNIETAKKMTPLFVSTVDSGNLVASIVIAREFLNNVEEKDLVKLCDKLIKNTNFKKLYTKQNVFSIGYDGNEEKLSIYNYNKFASESRLTSYLAIALGDVPSKHWFCLDKSLTTYKGRKGLISWSGTSFEYFMPLLYMKNYSNTLLDETYDFSVFCQKEYINSVDRRLPWGIGESAYGELDNSLNYKYKAFATPQLKAKEDKENRIVISPYSSIMAIELYPEDVYENIEKFKKLDMYNEYGLYEAYDYDQKEVVKSYFAHHEGMTLMGLANYIKHDCVKKYFHQNVNIRTFDILLKEKVQIKTNIDMKMSRYKKYNYTKETIENDIRFFDHISYLPEVSVLSNRKYSLLMNDRGNSFSRYRTLQLNRYRKVTELDYGLFVFAKDLRDDYIWSNTFAPMNVNPSKYDVIFAADKIKFIRQDRSITTTTEIVVCKNHHCEIRKITFKNTSDDDIELELTTYTEPILSDNMDDVSHKVFNNMFVTTEFDKNTNSLIAKRNSRGDNAVNSYMFNRLITFGDNPFSYETERSTFIGRNNTLNTSNGLHQELSNYSGDNLDPVLALRNNITVPGNGKKSIYVVMGFGRSKDQIKDIIKAYDSKIELEKAFKVSALMNIINTHNMNLTGENMRIYNIMLNYLYQTSRLSVSEERMDLLRKNALGQNGLWKFGVSGDRPIILVDIDDISDLGFIYDILKAFEYYKNNSIFIDLIIINSENSQFAKIIKKEIEEEKYRMYTLNSFYHTPGSINVINSDNITREDRSVLDIVPRLKFVLNEHKSLKDCVLELQEKNVVSDYPTYPLEENLEYVNNEKLKYDNGFGGFKNNGREYVVYNENTPMPWSNVISNKEFGTVITNNGCGFTFAYNSGEFKLSSWNNEMVVNDKSEGFKFNGKLFDPTKTTHGFGYSILESETKELAHEITEFVPVEGTVKVYLLKLTNKLKDEQKVDINFWINPALGNFEEKTSRHILTEFMGDDNYLKLRNVYNINYSDVNVYMSSSLPISGCTIDKILVKDLNTDITLKPGEDVYISFVLGCGYNDKDNIKTIKYYSDISNCKNELKNVMNYWKKTLSTITVKSPDPSFDYVVNGWYLYQTLSSRIMAKAGYYQVSGAFGYRDQLQDSMNIAMVQPDFTRRQILINASHQFEEGDVLHWWHEMNRFGLRSRYKDDYLWLVYATCNYIEITGDYDILNERVPYVVGDILSDYENEKGLTFVYSDKKDTLLEHLIKSLQLSMNSLGSHKLPLMGGGDWNDGMNRVGIKGKGESVWLGFFLYENINLFMKVMKKFDKKFDLSKYETFNEKLNNNLNKKAWDGDYYLRAYFDNGDKLGSHENSECKIDLISQSFAIISGVSDKQRTESCIKCVEKQLVDENHGIVKLLTPPFKKSLNNPGYIMDYPRGIRENGGQYTHAVSWYLMALIKAGYHDRAYRYYQMINPVNRTDTFEKTNSYKIEPYVIAADIYSAKDREGRGGWSWYTGSAGWFYRVAVQDILGLHKIGTKLKINPKIAIAWDGFKLVYNYMDTTYNIEVIKGKQDSMELDGVKQMLPVIDLVNDKKTHEVKVHIK